MSLPTRFRSPRLPRVSLALMVFFQLGGSLALLLEWPAGPAHLNWGIWIAVFGGYIFLIGACFFYVRTGR